MRMIGQKGDFDSKEMEKWLDSFFLDPLTSYLDETIFRVDLYDSESSFIVEALLPNVQKEQIDIVVDQQSIHIKVKDMNEEQTPNIKTRTVTFPIQISDKQMKATFENDILEIYIFKHQKKENKLP